MPDTSICTGPTPASVLKAHSYMWDKVHDRMMELMPGWFTMMDELMDPQEPFLSIESITSYMCNHLNANLDDVIHDNFKDWFENHPDGDKDW